MTGKRTTTEIESLEAEEAWQNAEAELERARNMPGSAERIDALRRAGQMRFDADKLRRAVDER